ncbi:hypothetical protein RirG_012070 [Rhizophagus irregularis DAOM 197198w]|uniref:Helix-turn-helix domain-containing protein n=1 Tax=Rhizophagus irregularis (strain DAOM 197198w) TaxID=1432141 RepID=A0A015KAI6_RHIIW|nr:hypothetical protein RirG_012070 [Rhizophagus irregularis DAOM 197198w]
MTAKEKGLALATAPGGTWVQTERATHEKWAKLIGAHPKAAALMHVIVGNMGRHNALVASVPNLQRMMGCSRNTVLRAISVLREQNWIEVRQLGAAVLVSDDEQPDRDEIGTHPPLERVPSLYPGERQLPTGPGLSPPSQGFFAGMEPDLPAIEQPEPDQAVPEGMTQLATSLGNKLRAPDASPPDDATDI